MDVVLSTLRKAQAKEGSPNSEKSKEIDSESSEGPGTVGSLSLLIDY